MRTRSQPPNSALPSGPVIVATQRMKVRSPDEACSDQGGVRIVETVHTMGDSALDSHRNSQEWTGRIGIVTGWAGFGNRRYSAPIAYSEVARRGRRRWALLLRRGAMMPQPGTRSNRRYCDGLRSCAATHGLGALPILQCGPLTSVMTLPRFSVRCQLREPRLAELAQLWLQHTSDVPL